MSDYSEICRRVASKTFFLEGGCHHFAAALNSIFDYNLVVFFFEGCYEWEELGFDKVPFHVVGEDSNMKRFDYRGQVSLSEIEGLLESEFEIIDSTVYYNPGRLYSEWAGLNEPLLQFDEQSFNEAKEIIQEDLSKYHSG
jgi:hypothetical protein